MSRKKTQDEALDREPSEAEETLDREPPEGQDAGKDPPQREEPATAEAQETRPGPSEELSQAKEQLLRLAAEYDNYRKRTAREREGIYANAKADAIEQLLPILDNLERAVAAPTSDDAYAQGVAMIAKQFSEILGKLGVCEIEALGKPFDSALHNAVMHEEREDAPQSAVAEVFQKGYIMGDRVIRYSVVKVVN